MRIKDERRSAVYDDELHLEAYRFEGIVQPFPAHFHEHYVLGLVERGERRLSCCGKELPLRAGDLLLLNPGDSHACEQRGGETLDYRSLTITQNVMLSLSEEITGTDTLPPLFSQCPARQRGRLRLPHAARTHFVALTGI